MRNFKGDIMKTQFLTIFLLVVMAAPEAFSQTRRGGNGSGGNGGGARTNPNRGNGGSTGPATRPTTRPTRPTTGPSTRPGTRPGTGGRVVVRPPQRPVRRVNPYRPNRNNYGTRNYHSPYGYRTRAYSPYRHMPVARTFVHSRRYSTPYNYFRYVRDYYRDYVYLNWIFYPSMRSNGYYQVDGYPYYVFNGYRNRYSEYDSCNYQLVDQNNHQVIRTYWNQSCYNGYNSCAYERDMMNEREWDNRYFCAETFRDNGYDFGRATYDYDYDDDLYNDYDYNGGNGDYYDDYYDSNNY